MIVIERVTRGRLPTRPSTKTLRCWRRRLLPPAGPLHFGW